MRTHFSIAAALLLCTVVGCSGGGSDGGVTGGSAPSSTLVGSFAADPDNPRGDLTVALAAVAAGGAATDLVPVRVTVAGTSDLFGASLDVTYDPARVAFVDWGPGTVLESGGESVSYQVNPDEPGRVVIGISRTGGAPGVDVVDPASLIDLVFRVLLEGTSDVAFDNEALLNADSPPQGIAGTSWYGGTMLAD